MEVKKNQIRNAPVRLSGPFGRGNLGAAILAGLVSPSKPIAPVPSTVWPVAPRWLESVLSEIICFRYYSETGGYEYQL